MSIYGNQIITKNNEPISMLENYIENSFLEMVLNEAVYRLNQRLML